MDGLKTISAPVAAIMNSRFSLPARCRVVCYSATLLDLKRSSAIRSHRYTGPMHFSFADGPPLDVSIPVRLFNP